MPTLPDESDAQYSKQVFINCPFDEHYWGIFQAMVFAIQACGFVPRCSLEADDAGEERLAKIIRIISDCRFGIHDLSRKGVDATSGFARFNMPYEMGVFQGAATYGPRKKAMLVMEAHPFDYKQFISDISGRDIRHHENDPAKVVSIIRDWLSMQRIVEGLPGGVHIAEHYSQLRDFLPLLLKQLNLHESEIEFPHFMNWSDVVKCWLESIGWTHRA